MTPPPRARAAVATALVLGMFLPAGRAAGDEAAAHLWLLSTRAAPRCVSAALGTEPIRYWRLDAQRQWQPADEDAFRHGDDSTLPTTVFIHGNRDDCNDAIDDGWHLCRLLQQQAGGRPFRFVIWSWPADRIPGRNRRDVHVKVAYCDVESFYLASQLNRLDPQTPVCLIGYSFGPRIITGALHLLAGGTLLGQGLRGDCPDFRPSENGTVPLRNARHASAPGGPPQRPIRAVLVAAAMDYDWLLPCHRNGLALSQVEQVLATRNRCDPVLKWYPRMYRRRGPAALGYTGPACGGEADKIELADVTCSVGKDHNWIKYTQAAGLRSRLGYYAFLQPPEPES